VADAFTSIRLTANRDELPVEVSAAGLSMLRVRLGKASQYLALVIIPSRTIFLVHPARTPSSLDRRLASAQHTREGPRPGRAHAWLCLGVEEQAMIAS
jgi:hypothetical protein